MIEIKDKKDCCGCSACAQICPKNSITMKTDDEGFLYPAVNKDTCVNCGLCGKICPVLNKPAVNKPLAIYAAKHKDTEVKLKSSSGGMFTALAEYILKQGGVVFGAAFDKDWQVCHQWAENIEDLDKLRRSKYVQSDINATYKKAEEFLKSGRQVLFTGTPCQIAGLKNYLRKDYDNLLTADIFCHGVPSPAVWAKFLKETYHAEDISFIDFRFKRFGWDSSYLNITLKNGKELSGPNGIFKLFTPLFKAKGGKLWRKVYRLPFSISNLYERPSCHACAFKGPEKTADFTMADLWGVHQIKPDFYDNTGVSVLLTNTEKAAKIFENLKDNLVYSALSYEDMVKYNPYFIKSVSPSPKRAEFFRRYKTENFYGLLNSFKPLKDQIFRLICKLSGGK